ncbi:hypothetical protein AVEN_159079-1 [Araneus ventricosus]|uniref:Uncharacterized protein n=1 Tax=Araneus ventricosus TaxID=182803 RepID=A0A4Y2B7X0_ARAVE|nr:hypothetical protein AVEN_159079-1 [Araneus ventricosus]
MIKLFKTSKEDPIVKQTSFEFIQKTNPTNDNGSHSPFEAFVKLCAKYSKEGHKKWVLNAHTLTRPHLKPQKWFIEPMTSGLLENRAVILQVSVFV